MSPLTSTVSKSKPTDVQGTLSNGQPRLQVSNPAALVANSAIIIDVNESMAPYWESIKLDVEAIADVLARYDEDGVDLYIPGYDSDEPVPAGRAPGGYYGISNPAYIVDLLNQVKLTEDENAHLTIASSLTTYAKYYEGNADADPKPEPLNVLAWTDGDFPHDEIRSAIGDSADALNRADAPANQLGIQFFRAGNNPAAIEAFTEFDEELPKFHGGRDIADHKPYVAGGVNQDSIDDILLGARDKSRD